ncbi:MAG: bacillithiol system redox-active protein YtxJ [Parcubacteria group bacterium]
MFRTTTHLSEILEESNKEPVIVFKYSNDCHTSETLKKELEEKIKNKNIIHPVYLVTVQIQKALSRSIEEMFQIKHESPQILIINKFKVTYTAHHKEISCDDFIFD